MKATHNPFVLLILVMLMSWCQILYIIYDSYNTEMSDVCSHKIIVLCVISICIFIIKHDILYVCIMIMFIY